MAGFFGFFDYTKPGPGIPKDAPPKARIVVFFEIFTRKFWNLIKINMMFSLFNIPAIIAVLFMSQIFITNNLSDDPGIDLALRFIICSILMCVPILTVGPAQAGFTYLLRNYAREEHAFIWWDFKEAAKKNFKQSMIICLIDLVVVLIIGIDINLYGSMGGNSFLMSIASGFLILAFVIYMMMHLYIYPMLVTFKLSIKQIYKNAFIFSIIKFFPNLGILLLCSLLVLASFYFTVIGFILMFMLTLSTIGLITNFYVYPQIKKYMIDIPEEAVAQNKDGESEGVSEIQG